MNSLKMTLAGLSLVFSFSALAEPPPAEFDKHKQEKLSHIDENLKAMNEHRACVAGAANPEAMKSCRLAMKEHHHEQKMERMEKRKAHMEKRMEKMKERRQPSEAGE